MNNTRSNQSDSRWSEIAVDKLTDRPLYPLLLQSDGLDLHGQVAVELGLYVPAGPADDTAPTPTVRVREIADATDRYATSMSAATRSQPLIATQDVGHPGREFLEAVSHVTALSVTTETATTEPIEIHPPTDGSFHSQFENTAAGSVGSALEYISQRCTHDVYVQLLIVPIQETVGSHHAESVDPGIDAEPTPSTTFAVGISILAGSSATGAETVPRERLQTEAVRAAKRFKPSNSTATFTVAWRHSTPPAEFIETPRLRPDATRYRWLSQHLGLAPLNKGIQTAVNKGGLTQRDVHDKLPRLRELLGTPGKFRVRESGLRWLFGDTPANRPHTER